MTVNANVRFVEWFDAAIITPTNARYVIGWYDDGHPRVVRLNGDTWWLQNSGPGQLCQEFAKPTHWCEFPEGPGTAVSSKKEDPQPWHEEMFMQGFAARGDGQPLDGPNTPLASHVGEYAAKSWRAGWCDADFGITAASADNNGDSRK